MAVGDVLLTRVPNPGLMLCIGCLPRSKDRKIIFGLKDAENNDVKIFE